MILWYKMCHMFCLIMITDVIYLLILYSIENYFGLWLARMLGLTVSMINPNVSVSRSIQKLINCLHVLWIILNRIWPIFNQYFIKRKLLDLFSNLDYYLVPFVNKVIGHDCRHKTAAVDYLRRHRLMSAASL